MKRLTFDIDYTYCPEGHAWILIGSSTLYPEVFWCEQCDAFYEPSVRRVERGQINQQFSSDREADLIRLAGFYEWRNGLTVKDMPKAQGAS